MEKELNMNKIIMICLFAPFYQNIAFGQAYRSADKAVVILHASVFPDSALRSLYSYDIHSDISSRDVFSNFALSVADSMLTRNLTKVFTRGNKKWYFNGSNLGLIVGSAASHFLDIPPDNGLSPGESMQISFKSAGLPAIVKYYASSFVAPLTEIEVDSLRAVGYSDKQLFPDWKENSYSGVTISPNTDLLTLGASTRLDTLISYVSRCRFLGWITSQDIADKYSNYYNSAKSSLQQNNFAAVRTILAQVLSDVNIDSISNLTSEAYALIRYNTEYLLSQLPTNPAPGLAVRLVSSGGTALADGSLQYYEGSWKDAVNNNDGTFNVNTTLTNVSLRMTFAYGSQTKSNVPVNGGPVTFQTVNTQVKLQNSQGNLIDQGAVQYYAGAWRDLGVTTNGVATMELLPASYSFRMTYAYGSNDKQQDIGSNPAVVFQTVNAAVQLKNSQGTLMDAGTVQYYAGAWRDFGATSNGVATKELLPANYSFRMTYAFASKDMQQNIGTNGTVAFSTVLCTVRVSDSQRQLVSGAAVSYYSGAWRVIGNTVNGEITKELLPANLSFRASYGGKSQDKAQNLTTNAVVEIVLP
jgi:hypothetical protein